MKIIIAGSRGFNSYQVLHDVCDDILKQYTDIEIISGAANGADMLGERYARKKNYKITRFYPEWEKYGKRAGYLRNKAMAEVADYCICFWDGKSPGSKLMIELCEQFNVRYRVVLFKESDNTITYFIPS